MRILILLTAVILLSGCATQRRCARKFPPQVKTEIKTEVETVYRDTTIYVYVPADTITLTDTIQVYVTPEGYQTRLSELHTDLAFSTAQVVDGSLRHDLMQKETEIERVIKNAVKEQSTHTVEKEVETHEVRYIPNFYWILLGLILGLGLIGWLRR